jgi:tetratricopeptide (TPR) repeat protein
MQIGEHNQQVNQFIENYIEHQDPVAVPVVVGDVPQEPSAFQARPELMDMLAGEPGGQVAVVSAVTGLRGVGKTQVAAAHARLRMAQGWPLVAWLNAQEPASVLAGLAAVGAALGIGTPGEDASEVAVRVRHRLETGGARCLLVFDNAADMDGLRPFLPAAGEAQVVITSNRQAAQNLGVPVPVDVFTMSEALAFLVQRTELTDDAGARELAEELGRLPLGLAQAAAVITQERLAYGTYLERLRALPLSESLPRVEGDPYPHGLAEAVLLSLRSIEASDPAGLCMPVMALVAMLAEAGAARWVLHAAGPTLLPDGRSDAASVDAALGRLADASLLSFSVDGSAVVAHRLVMRVTRERLIASGTLALAAAAAVKILAGLADTLERPWESAAAARELARQATGLAGHVGQDFDCTASTVARDLLRLRIRAVQLLDELGDSTGQMMAVGLPLVADCERVLGPDHPQTLSAKHNLAIAYRQAARVAEAIPLHEQVLADRERVLGPDHPQTLGARDNLASAYRRAGRVAEAIPLQEQVLAAYEQVLGPDDPQTLGAKNNLAIAYEQAARVAEAIPLHEQVLADRERVLGADHPQTVYSRNSLASAYQVAGRAAEAVPLYGQVLADHERVFGPGHPEVASALINLGAVRLQLGELTGARADLERALAISEAAGRPDPAQVADALTGLGAVQLRLAELPDARANLERALAISEEVYGPGHPGVASALFNLSAVHLRLRQLKNARAAIERALAISEAVYGRDHPQVAPALITLGAVQLELGKPKDARASIERALEISEAVYGCDHPEVASALINLGVVQLRLEKLTEARTSLERALEISEAVYGCDHPEVASALINLGVVYFRLGKLTEARASLERALEISEAVYGSDHPEVASILFKVSAVQLRLGDLKDARARLDRAREITETAYGSDHPHIACTLINFGIDRGGKTTRYLISLTLISASAKHNT